MDKSERRLRRQFQELGRSFPRFQSFIAWLTAPRARLLRIPAATMLIAGSTLFFLPGLGLWMLPLGLMLLAVDVAIMRGPVSSAWIRTRRRLRRWRAGAGRH